MANERFVDVWVVGPYESVREFENRLDGKNNEKLLTHRR